MYLFFFTLPPAALEVPNKNIFSTSDSGCLFVPRNRPAEYSRGVDFSHLLLRKMGGKMGEGMSAPYGCI